MINIIASKEVQLYIREHEHTDEKALVLKHSTLFGLPTSALAEQIQGRKRAKEKIPLLYSANGIIYPPSLNLEQCSSEETGRYKTEILKKIFRHDQRIRCADLTGGFGVDSFFFSQIFKLTEYIEPDEKLLKIVQHNHQQLGCTNILYHNTRAEHFLEESKEPFDLIFLDPSRRTTGNKKVFKFSDGQPDVKSLLPLLFSKTNYLLLKASPLIDIQAGILDLAHVKTVYIVSVNNECKEVLFLCVRETHNEPLIHSINIQHKMTHVFSFTRIQENQADVSFSEPLTYLYEPNASILKSGAFKLMSTTFGLDKLHPNTHLYTSHEVREDFPGRIFKILSGVKPDTKSVRPFFTAGKANVITRNFPMTADALKRKVRLKDGGDKYLIACSSKKSKHIMVADRIK